MKQKRQMPVKYLLRENPLPETAERFPFHISRYGYCCEKKFSLGDENDRNDFLLLLSLSSVVEFSRQRDVKYLSAFDMVITACNAPLRFRVVGPAKWEFFYVVINGSHARYFYNLVRTSNHILRVNPLSRVPDLFISMAETAYDGSGLSCMHQSLLVHDLMDELYQISSSIVTCKGIVPPQETDVNSAIRYIAGHYSEPLTVDIVCNKVCLSKYYFCKIFKAYTGTSLHRYINEYRINKSKELLSYSKLSILAIAESVGFKNVLTYIRNFERAVHMTPGEYRKNF